MSHNFVRGQAIIRIISKFGGRYVGKIVLQRSSKEGKIVCLNVRY